jgi:undecaprenyl-diphosphatase
MPHSFSFPSGHTATSFAAAYAVARTLGRRWAWLYAVAALIAFSRLYLGVHYPADVLGGIILGTLTAASVCFVTAKYIKPRFPEEQPIQKRR